MFAITADEARKIAEVSNTCYTTQEIVGRIEKAIEDASKKSQYSADYALTHKDFLLQGNPKRFKESLKEKGFSVQYIRNNDPRDGYNELVALRISWPKQ